MVGMRLHVLFSLSLFATLAGCAADVGLATGEAVVCGRGPTVEGIDVSVWQGGIDWGAVASDGISFAIVRISDGGYHDRNFAANWEGARAAGLIRGAYQFFEPDQDPVAQADIVIAAVGTLGPNDLPVTCDVEAPGPGVDPGEYTRRLHVWVDRVTAGTGRAPIIYTGRYYWDPFVASSDFTSLPLWHAQYTSASCPNINDRWSDWVFWQYTSTGSVAGIAGNVDRNRFNGTIEELRVLAASNRRPSGWLDAAACDGITGWAHDPDAPEAAIDVHLYFGGPAGDPAAIGVPIHANLHRDDLCGAIGSCAHGFSARPPLSLFDGLEHPVYAYGIDASGGENAQLMGAPLTMRCESAPVPMLAEGVVRRHVSSPEVLAAWGLGFVDVAPLSDAAIDAIADGPDVSPAPVLVQIPGEPAVYLRDGDVLRHVPSPAVMDAWRFSFGAIAAISAEDALPLLEGAPVLDAPFLARGTGAAVYLIDAPPPLWAELVSDTVPERLSAGQATNVRFVLQNRGSATWAEDETFLVATSVGSELCDDSWPSCDRAATVNGEVAPGDEGTFEVRLLAPTTPGPLSFCFGLRHHDHAFGEPGENGPADDVLCHSVTVIDGPVTDPGVEAPGGERHGLSGNCSASPMRGGVLPLLACAGCALVLRRRR